MNFNKVNDLSRTVKGDVEILSIARHSGCIMMGDFTKGGVISTSMVERDDVVRYRAVPGERPEATCPATHGGCECNPHPP